MSSCKHPSPAPQTMASRTAQPLVKTVSNSPPTSPPTTCPNLHNTEVSEEPTFALGDSDGIAPANVFTILMIDTTDDNTRTLQYARSNFKHSTGVKLESETQPLVEYKAPGAAGESGGERKLTFLMFRNPERTPVESLELPGDGEAFDVKKFQDDNGFQDATGGLAMVVSLDGTDGPAPSSSATSAQRTTATAAPSSTNAPVAPSSTNAPVAPSSTNAPAAPTSAVAPSSNAAPSSATAPEPPASTTAAQGPGAAPAPSTSDSAEESQAQTSVATGPTTSLAPASDTPLVPAAPTPSTVLLSTVVPDASATASNAPAEQTGSGAGMLSMPWVECAVLAPFVVFAGLLV